MSVKNLKSVNLLDSNQLSVIKGGNRISAGEFGQALGVCTAGGAAVGGLIGNVPGAIAGGIYGAQYCTAAWALLRTH
ncbi:ComC/BlpC family peptide pheromone/bacteriocin [Streptococcus chenjunshii]|uniref:ComC/BlpC family peptide pheromone/bacteriocin n=1 Tax=Streptococcus chenjunshii TaxID=2173853 RepID=A0A372KM58_9STRE|nr:Blp family class II bacteriocin [Streptococcus chenjunshii]AXQ79134.1 ComC/BlpC family peptide pheromone/bacteriocin [Streptococcus chenjunshii]RFU50967.1 ComC/BlpC family peptide pheromone/bacteriocin [Streptococcus chenjunshii]RFU53359.1 ComC/BlpC family peptide pheromone/bacteriocin [Streptococcus chenjunshii]